MAPSGRKPKPPGQAVTRHQPAHGWIEVDPTPFDGPNLPAHRRDGTPWPESARDTWEAWRTMPHARLWNRSDWGFALDTLELASRAFHDGAKVGLLTELRYREKVMGTTYAARMDMRLRYAAPIIPRPASVWTLDDYREL
ncbi:MAG: hypothetical protein HYZ38_12970 [Mycobacterium sp.]|nr:hypothetical protein [Mycobacterium sp.]